MDAEEKRVFFGGGPFNPPDPFEGISSRAYEPNSSKDLIEPSSAFIGNHPNLEAIRLRHLEAYLTGIVRITPDLAVQFAERERLTKENKPRYARIIDITCEGCGMELVHITAGDPGLIHKGEEWVAWHFLTDHGYYSTVGMGERTVVFSDDGDEIAMVGIARILAG